jgi:choline kinase
MTEYVIIPMGGMGLRFFKAGYKTYKPFLKVSKTERIIDNIINNFSLNTQIIIVGSKKKSSLIKKKMGNRIIFIEIKYHKKGPLYSIFLARNMVQQQKLISVIRYSKNNEIII